MDEPIPARQPFAIRFYRPLLMAAVLIIILFWLSPPLPVVDKLYGIGFAICHQIPSRTFHIHNEPLPLCARCTGIYLGLLTGLGILFALRRHHTIKLPPPPILATLIGFVGIMGFDGVNSYLTFFPGMPHLYEPQNWLRLTTGTLHGLAMAGILLPMVNETLWLPSLAVAEPMIKNFKELGFMLIGGAAVVLLVLWQADFLLYPLMILSTLGVLVALTLIFSVFAAMLTGLMGTAVTWRDTLLPFLLGLSAALIMLTGMYWFRTILTTAVGLPI